MTGPAFVHVAATLSAALATIAINALWEGALLVIGVWLLLRAWPKVNAATRYLVWCATLVAVVAVPVATTLPFLTYTQTTAAQPAPAKEQPASTPMHEARIPLAPHNEVPAGAVPRNAAPPPRIAGAPLHVPSRLALTMPIPVAYVIVGLWLAVALVSIVRLALGLRSLERLKHDALPLPVAYRDAMQRWGAANKGLREVRLCVSDEIDVPVAVGLFDSMILIPRQLLERLSENEIDQISLHELAHLRRADDWSNGLQRLALAVFGWNPAVRFISAQLDLEREVACDDWVLSLTGSVRPYALTLTKMAETFAWPHHPMPAPGVFATRRHISVRIERLLGAGRNVATNLAMGPAAAAIVIVGALAFIMQMVAPSVAAPVVVTVPPISVTVPEVKVQAKAETIHVPAVHVDVPAKVVHVPETHTVVEVRPVERVVTKTVIVQKPASAETHATTVTTLPEISFSMPPIPGPEFGRALEKQIKTSIGAASSAAAKAALSAHVVADASSARNCNGCDMAGVNWEGRDLRGVNYTGVDLTRARLAGADFSGGSFNGVDFSRSDLHGASFRNAKLTGCDFSHADLRGVSFAGATMSGCQFTGAEMTSTELRSILDTCTGCDFTKANLAGVDLSGIRTSGIDFTGANLTGVNFSGAQLTGVDFSKAALANANFAGATLNGCDLSSVDLSHVDLSRATLIGTDLSHDQKP